MKSVYMKNADDVSCGMFLSTRMCLTKYLYLTYASSLASIIFLSVVLIEIYIRSVTKISIIPATTKKVVFHDDGKPKKGIAAIINPKQKIILLFDMNTKRQKKSNTFVYFLYSIPYKHYFETVNYFYFKPFLRWNGLPIKRL